MNKKAIILVPALNFLLESSGSESVVERDPAKKEESSSFFSTRPASAKEFSPFFRYYL